jgi:hypothetical protein
LSKGQRCAIVVWSALFARLAFADTCPITECNYLDPLYQAAYSKYMDCVNAVTANFDKYMGTLAILHPRFGIAWNAYSDEVKAATHSDGTIDSAAIQAARQRFDDRILRTAEPEALEWYNLYTTKMRANFSSCGSMPEPPKGQPKPIK